MYIIPKELFEETKFQNMKPVPPKQFFLNLFFLNGVIVH